MELLQSQMTVSNRSSATTPGKIVDVVEASVAVAGLVVRGSGVVEDSVGIAATIAGAGAVVVVNTVAAAGVVGIITRRDLHNSPMLPKLLRSTRHRYLSGPATREEVSIPSSLGTPNRTLDHLCTSTFLSTCSLLTYIAHCDFSTI